MAIPLKAQKWLNSGIFPQRVLLSGEGDLLKDALLIAASLQECDITEIEKGANLDTIVFRDSGKSFKIDFSEAAKKDNQSEYENVRGMIKWANHKPISKQRIVILENFDRVWREANHALLKILEEPPTKAVFIFTTRNHHKILDTILSRMTVVCCSSEDNEQLEISDNIKTFLEDKNLIIKFKQINDLDTMSKENKESKINRQVFLKFLEQCVNYARLVGNYQAIEDILEVIMSIEKNQNPKFSLERLAIKLTNR